MKKTRYVFASLAALALVATACGSDKNTTTTGAPSGTSGGAATSAAPAETSAARNDSCASETSSADTVNVTAGQDITIAVITHGDGGVFWSVFQKGAEDAGKMLGITVEVPGFEQHRYRSGRR